MNILKRSLLGACIALVLGGVAFYPASTRLFGGTAQGAIAYNRASMNCPTPAGYDAGAYTRQVDPIKSFGAPVSAHNHNFCGALPFASLSAATYPLRAGHESEPGYEPIFTNFNMYGIWPGEWVPVAKLNGTDTKPVLFRNTWQAPRGTHVIPPPFGAALLSGNAMATQPDPKVRFTCGDIDGPGGPNPTDCTGVPGGVVTGEISFPDCWDGQGATRPDPLKQFVFDAPYGIRADHFSYSTNGVCPAGSIPCVPGQLMAQLVLQVTWMDNRATLTSGAANPDFNKTLRNPLNTDGSMALSFSSGAPITFHGDYLVLENHMLNDSINYCLNTGGPSGQGCPAGTYINFVNATHRLD